MQSCPEEWGRGGGESRGGHFLLRVMVSGAGRTSGERTSRRRERNGERQRETDKETERERDHAGDPGAPDSQEKQNDTRMILRGHSPKLAFHLEGDFVAETGKLSLCCSAKKRFLWPVVIIITVYEVHFIIKNNNNSSNNSCHLCPGPPLSWVECSHQFRR